MMESLVPMYCHVKSIPQLSLTRDIMDQYNSELGYIFNHLEITFSPLLITFFLRNFILKM